MFVEKARSPHCFVIGFALFSMFFGAGNLIFPLLIGKSVGDQVWVALIGLGITAVVVPFLGLAAMLLFQANFEKFFGRVGSLTGIVLLLFLQLILGPMGVIPRLFAFMHVVAKPYLLGMPLPVFSVLMGALMFACSTTQKRLVSLLGVILTPILLLSLASLLCSGLTGDLQAPVVCSAKDSFLQGLLGGYNTMDLIASFLFAAVAFPSFQGELALEDPEKRKKQFYRKMFSSSMIAASLLFLTYMGLCLIAAYHGWTLNVEGTQKEEMLNAIATKLLGPIGGGIAALTVIVACFTTAITLVAIFAEYLRKDLCREKIHPTVAYVGTLLIATLFANLGFQGIVAFLGPLLQILYPGLILLTLLNLFALQLKPVMVRALVFCAFSCSAIFYFS